MNNLCQFIVNEMLEGVYYTDKNRKITFWNEAATKISGYTKDEVVGSYCYNNILQHIDDNGNYLCKKGCPLIKSIEKSKMTEMNVYLHHKNGYRVPVCVRATPMYDDENNIIGIIEFFTDISSNLDIIKELEKLKNKVYIDKLTNCANREFAEIQLEKKINDWKKLNVPFGVCFLDIDNFKNINDTYGHTKADEVLKMTAKSTKNSLRPLDNICRWGGEEFIIILPNTNKKNIIKIAERIRLFIENSWVKSSNDEIIKVTASIGCSIVEKNDSIKTIIEKADKAMYEAKKAGKNKVVYK